MNMRQIIKSFYLIFFVILVCISCETSGNGTAQDRLRESNQRQTVQDKLIEGNRSNNISSIDTIKKWEGINKLDSLQIDFLTSCNDLQVWFGSIQSNDEMVKDKIYPMAECNSNESYDLIWVPERMYNSNNIIPSQDVEALFKKGKANNFNEFIVFSFVIPKIPLDDLKGEFDMNLVFPSNVKVYKFERGIWTYVLEQLVTNFEEYTSLQAKLASGAG